MRNIYSSIFTVSFIFTLFLSGCGFNQKQLTEFQSQNKLLSEKIRTTYPTYANSLDSNFPKYLINRLTNNFSNPLKLTLNFHHSSIPFAYTTGEGDIFISTSLLQQLSTEAELAFIVAHEIAHRYYQDNEDLFLSKKSQSEYNRQMELTADKFAVVLMISAGYDPRGAAAALNRTYSQSGIISSTSHPSLNDRIKVVTAKISEVNWQPPGTIDRRDFQNFLKDSWKSDLSGF